jgi:hypothetical protein
VKDAMTKQVGIVTGSVRQVFAPNGKLIKSLDEFKNEGQYIAAGAEKLNKEQSESSLHSLVHHCMFSSIIVLSFIIAFSFIIVFLSVIGFSSNISFLHPLLHLFQLHC